MIFGCTFQPRLYDSRTWHKTPVFGLLQTTNGEAQHAAGTTLMDVPSQAQGPKLS